MALHGLHLVSLGVIGITWWFAWRVGRQWCRRCGIDERADAWALACVLPTAGLIVAVHLPALASLLSGRGWTTPEPVAVIFVLLTGLARYRCARFDPCESSATPTRAAPAMEPGLWWTPLAIVVGLYAVFLLDALTRFPTGYDALYYHLPVAVRWMQERALNLVFGFNYLSHPENGMIVPYLLSFGELERLMPLVHLPKALLVAATIYGLTRALNVSRPGAGVSLCVALSVPIVVFQSFSGYVDLYAASAWLSALLALTWAARVPHQRQRRALLVLSGLAAGVALGSKITMLVGVALLGLAAMAVEWIRPGTGGGDRKRPIRNVAVFGSAVLACSAFWFVRGTLQAGNPVYPLAVKVGKTTILAGVTADDFFPERALGLRLQRWWNYAWRETKRSGTGYPYSVNNGVGAAYAAFVPLGVLAAVLSLSVRRPRAGNEKWLLVFVLLSLSGVVLLLTIFHEMLRFVLPQLLLAVPVAALLIDRLIARYPRTVHAMLSSALALTAVVAAYPPAHAFAVRMKHGLWDRPGFYRIPPLVDDLAPGTRILNTGEPRWNYPLLGRHLRNVVMDPNVWRAATGPAGMTARALRENAIDYIYVRQPWPTDWPDDLPIEIIYDDSDARSREGLPASRLYRVLPAAPSDPCLRPHPSRDRKGAVTTAEASRARQARRVPHPLRKQRVGAR